MTPSLAELRALEQAATPGPWEVERDSDFDERTFTEFAWPWRVKGVCSFADEGGSEADAALIVAARNALPGLLERVAAAEAERDKANERLERERKARKATEGLRASEVVARRTNLEARVEAAEAERDALRTALAALVDDVDDVYGPGGDGPALAGARAVLAAPVPPGPAAGGET